MSQVDVSQDYGAMLIGGLLAFSLSGCVNMQFIVYWRLYPGESYYTKSLVIATWLLDLCHSAFLAIALWDSIIVPYGDLDQLDNIPWSVGPTIELAAMITFLVQSFFAYRIYRLEEKRLTVVIPIAVLAFCRLVAASASMAEMISLESYSAFGARPFPSWIFTLGLTLSAFVDVTITTSLCYLLRKNRTMITRLSYDFDHTTGTVRLLDTLTLWTIQNGSITCTAAVASLVCWTCMPQNRIFLGIHFVMAKLYANSLLATINSRQKMRDERQHSSIDSRPLPHIFSTRLDPRRLGDGDLTHGQPIRVNVERVVDSKYDDGIKLQPTRSRMDDDSVI